MKILYFAWLREKIGMAGEDVDLPADVQTVGDLLAWFESRGDNYQLALTEKGVVRVAVDQEHVTLEHPLAGAREVALFPPVTGG